MPNLLGFEVAGDLYVCVCVCLRWSAPQQAIDEQNLAGKKIAEEIEGKTTSELARRLNQYVCDRLLLCALLRSRLLPAAWPLWRVIVTRYLCPNSPGRLDSIQKARSTRFNVCSCPSAVAQKLFVVWGETALYTTLVCRWLVARCKGSKSPVPVVIPVDAVDVSSNAVPQFDADSQAW